MAEIQKSNNVQYVFGTEKDELNTGQFWGWNSVSDKLALNSFAPKQAPCHTSEADFRKTKQ